MTPVILEMNDAREGFTRRFILVHLCCTGRVSLVARRSVHAWALARSKVVDLV